MQGRKAKHIIAAVIAAAVIIITTIAGGGAAYAHAAVTTSAATAFEQSNVWNDLQGATVDGKGIDLSLYNFDEKKNVQLISFVEFGYSFRSDKQSDYGLYVYVYNPHGYDWTKNPGRQNIKMRYGANNSANFETYLLQYLNRSEQAGCEGLFYKFKLILSATQRAAILAGVKSSGRSYEVGEIELCSDGKDLTAYDVSNKYTYTGFAKDYGSDSAANDSLSCASDGLITLTLDVHAAAYRPPETNGKPFTQDMLHSVYFSIPNEILNEYGGLSAVHTRWLNAKTAPMFVTGNEAVYNDIFEQIETYAGNLKKHTEYALLVNGSMSMGVNYPYMSHYKADSAYNVDGVGSFGEALNCFGVEVLPSQKLNSLYYAFLADNGNADDYELKGEKVIEYLKYFSGKTTSEAPLVAGKYNPVLFESYDGEYTDKNIKAGDKYSLTNTKLSQSVWQKFLGNPGTQVEYSKTFDNIEAIHPVTADDFRNTEEATCNRLYIDQSYYNDFKVYYDRAEKAEETLFLFRYYQSEYVSKEVTEFVRRYDVNGFMQDKIQGGDVALRKLDTNAYMAQEVINLDFDIIDVTCTKGNVSTVIANVMSPMDIAPNITPPLITTQDKKPFDFWQWLADLLHVDVKTAKIIFWCVVCLVVLAIALPVLNAFIPAFGAVLKAVVSALVTGVKYLFIGLWQILKFLFTGLWWIISAPFRLIAKAINNRKDKPKPAGRRGTKPKKQKSSKPKHKKTGKK